MYIKGGTMKIIRARVNNYKSIDDSSWVDMEDVTALVGKNESGKTAFLQAIRKINSIAGAEDQFSIMDYPRKGYIRYKNSNKCFAHCSKEYRSEDKKTYCKGGCDNAKELSEQEDKFSPLFKKSKKFSSLF